MSKKKVDDVAVLLTPNTLRNLNDKLYEKRKLGALEIEQQVKELVKSKDVGKVAQIIQLIKEQFIVSTSVNARKGGLIALAAAALGLGSEINEYIAQLLPPVLQCFVDHDNKVRYYACESLYNIAKVARGKTLPYFNEIFDGLCKLSADPDGHVRNGAELLDRLMKDIVTEGNTINIEKFIPILSQRVRVINPECRKFVIGWIVVLNAVPDLDLLDRLPSFLDGIFLMLSDRSEHIREVVNATLSEFLEEIKRRKAQTIDYGALIQILVPHCTSDDELTCLTALKWIQEMIAFGKEKVLLYSAQLLGGILPSVSHKSKSIEDAAREANRKLEELIQTTPLPVQAQEIFKTIQYFAKSPQFSIPTRIHALRWILILHSKNAPELLNSLDELFQNLITTLSDPSEEVVRMDLQVLSKLSADESYFDKLMHKVLQVFSSDRKLLETRGNLIIRQLSLHIKAEKIYRALAKILETAEDPTFASTMIQILNLILLTSTELYEVREMLKSLATKQSCDLFVTLYKSWSHNAVALFSLCLLAQVYEHAARLVMKFGELEVTVSFLMEIDKLVQLLESPIFIYLRLQLLEPEKYPFLIKCLYGLLLLLPQSSAFETLKNRLSCISSLGVLQLIPRSKDVPKPPPGIDFEALLNHFDQTQKRHSEYIRKIRLDTEHALQQLYQTKKQVPLDMLDQSENATGASDIVTSVKRVMRRQIGSSQTVAPPPPPPGPNSNTSNVPQNETKANSEK